MKFGKKELVKKCVEKVKNSPQQYTDLIDQVMTDALMVWESKELISAFSLGKKVR